MCTETHKVLDKPPFHLPTECSTCYLGYMIASLLTKAGSMTVLLRSTQLYPWTHSGSKNTWVPATAYRNRKALEIPSAGPAQLPVMRQSRLSLPPSHASGKRLPLSCFSWTSAPWLGLKGNEKEGYSLYTLGDVYNLSLNFNISHLTSSNPLSLFVEGTK